MRYPPYSRFAEIYDQVMREVDYEMWAAYVEELLRRHDISVTTVLDLCCGTGSSTLPFARRGYAVTGVDRSSEMLEVARAKARALGLAIPFVCQDARELDLEAAAGPGVPAPGSVDAVVSLFDSLNYLLDPEELETVFRRVARILRPGGAFLFDLNSEEKLASLPAKITFLEGEGYVLFWRDHFLPEERIWEITLDCLYRRGEGWERWQEKHREKAHPTAVVRARLEAAGLKVLGVYHAYTFSPVRPGADRIFFVACRPPR